MPDEGYWTTFFDAEGILRDLGLDNSSGTVIDLGCGYGTFTLPIARLTQRPVLAIDIEPELAQAVERKAAEGGINGIRGITRDVVSDGYGQPDDSIALVLLFNLLHCEDPIGMLRATHRVLGMGGRVGIIHWRSDVATPRGPALAIRPRPDQIEAWLKETGFTVSAPPRILPPYHFGLVGTKP